MKLSSDVGINQGISTHFSKQARSSMCSAPNHAHVLREELASIDSLKSISYIRNHLALPIPALESRRKSVSSS